jgi:hypothetical protein
MTLQHRFAENRSLDRAFVAVAGCSAGFQPASVKKAGWKPALQGSGPTLIVVNLLPRAPDEAHLARCFPAQNPVPEKTNS